MTTPNNLGCIRASSKSGDEPFHDRGETCGFELKNFWQWIASDLVSNSTRGLLAEYLVARALDLDTTAVRDEWAAFDLKTLTGIKVEVKSAAYIQSWHQEKLSNILFRVGTSRAWDSETNKMSQDSKRQAGVYVFALLENQDKTSIDPLDVSQWRFYVAATKTLDSRQRNQHSITLKSLEKLCGPAVRFSELRKAIEQAAPECDNTCSGSNIPAAGARTRADLRGDEK